VEPEIALVLDRDPGPHASAEDVLRCCRSAHLALEVVDSVWWGYRFDLEHNTADGSSAAGFALGDPLPLDVDAQWHVSLVRWVGDGSGSRSLLAQTPDATGSASMRAAAESLSWLATELSSRPAGLAPGDIVLTGGLTRSFELSADDDAVAVAEVHDVRVATVSLFGSAG
jgi:2-keto-4-pentenoate hydratase